MQAVLKRKYIFPTGYLMGPDQFGSAVSCYTPNEHFSDFIANLGTACEDIHAIMGGKNFKEGRKV